MPTRERRTFVYVTFDEIVRDYLDSLGIPRNRVERLIWNESENRLVIELKRVPV